MGSAEIAETYMQGLLKEGEKPVADNITAKCKSIVERKDFDGMPVFYFGNQQTEGPVVLYLHGGAYVYQIDPSQISFCDKLSRTRNTLVIAPCYPLSPFHTYKEAYDKLISFYQDLCKRYPHGITLLGDSAGAGLAAGMTAVAKEQNLRLPKRLILCSPWVDVEMNSTDYSLRQKDDPMLNAGALRVMARYWAGNDNLDDYHLSPTFADLTGFPPVDIHSGTRDILYDDAEIFYHRLLEADVDASFSIGNNLPHDYVMIPAPEQKEMINGFIL